MTFYFLLWQIMPLYYLRQVHHEDKLSAHMATSLPDGDEDVTLQTPWGERVARVRTPVRLAPHPTLIITLANTRQSMLNDDGYRTVGDIMLAAGHRVASFDLPNHGPRIDQYGAKLEGMAAAISAGVDVFADIRDTGKTLIDHAIAHQWTRPGEIALMGISRGGLSALHVMAADQRVGAAAIISPVTLLTALKEFAHLQDNEIIQRSNAATLINQLADRWLFIACGQTDPRVHAGECFKFHANLRARAITKLPTLYVGPGQSHGHSFEQHFAYQAAAAFLLYRLTEISKCTTFEPKDS